MSWPRPTGVSDTDRSSGFLLVDVLLWALVLALAWRLVEAAGAVGGTTVWVGLLHPVLFGLTAWPIWRDFRRGRRWVRIEYGVLAMIYLYAGIGGAYYLLRFERLSYPSLMVTEGAALAMALVLAGTVAFRIGARGPWARTLADLPPALPGSPAWSGALRATVLSAIGFAVVVQGFLLASGRSGFMAEGADGPASGVWSLLAFASRIGLIGLSVAFYYWYVQRDLRALDRWLLAVATLVLFCLALLTGMKSEVVLVCMSAALPFLLARSRPGHRLGLSGSAATAVAGVALLVLFAVNPLLRDRLVEAGGTHNRLEVAGEILSGTAGAYGDAFSEHSVLTTGLEVAWNRFGLFPYLVTAVEQTPEQRDFRRLDRYRLFVPMLVAPRLLWPDKPVNQAGTDFQLSYISGEHRFSTTPTLFGWTYMEYGMAGTVVGLLLFGCLVGVVESYTIERHGLALPAVVLYVVMAPTLLDLEADPFWMLLGIPRLLAVGIVGYVAIVGGARLIQVVARTGRGRLKEGVAG